MSEQTQMDEKPESMKETFIAPEFSTNPAEMIHLAVSGIIEELMNCEDLFQDEDLTSRPSSTHKDKESSCSLSQSSLDEDRVSIATSERISYDVQSEESKRESSTGIKKMSDFSQTDKEADELMKCDDLLEDEAMDLRPDLSFLNEEHSHTLSWGSLSWDSRATCYWSDRPSSSASSSSANSAIPSPQSQKKAGSVIQIKVRSFCPRPSDDEDSSHQEEAEAGEAKQKEPSDPAPASSKTTITSRGKFFRWMKKNKIHPLEVDVSTGQSSDCPPETCSRETKTKKGNGFTRFFRGIFSKNKKKPKQDEMENGQKKTCAERRVTLSPFSWFGAAR